MQVNGGSMTCGSWRWFGKRCLGITMALLVLFVSLIAGTIFSAIFFRAVEL